jgi:hypothetical protein
MLITRRHCLAVPVASVAGAFLTNTARAEVPAAAPADSFPAQDPDLVKEMVIVSHGNRERVEALLKESPRLANAAYDWGFGDWETCLGAASHTGRKKIAAALLEAGARPDIFAMTMLGKLDAVKAMIAAQPNLQRTRGPHGLTLAHHARMGGDDAAPVAEYLKTLEGADEPYKDEPLTDAQRDSCPGDYAFGPGEDQRFKILVPEKDTHLAIQRGKGFPRQLFHQGNLVFHPVGAPEVRIAFTMEDGEAVSATITNPSPGVIGRRI